MDWPSVEIEDPAARPDKLMSLGDGLGPLFVVWMVHLTVRYCYFLSRWMVVMVLIQ